jgi:hypothetical protein
MSREQDSVRIVPEQNRFSGTDDPYDERFFFDEVIVLNVQLRATSFVEALQKRVEEVQLGEANANLNTNDIDNTPPLNPGIDPTDPNPHTNDVLSQPMSPPKINPPKINLINADGNNVSQNAENINAASPENINNAENINAATSSPEKPLNKLQTTLKGTGLLTTALKASAFLRSEASSPGPPEWKPGGATPRTPGGGIGGLGDMFGAHGDGNNASAGGGAGGLNRFGGQYGGGNNEKPFIVKHTCLTRALAEAGAHRGGSVEDKKAGSGVGGWERSQIQEYSSLSEIQHVLEKCLGYKVLFRRAGGNPQGPDGPSDGAANDFNTPRTNSHTSSIINTVAANAGSKNSAMVWNLRTLCTNLGMNLDEIRDAKDALAKLKGVGEEEVKVVGKRTLIKARYYYSNRFWMLFSRKHKNIIIDILLIN